MWVAVRRASQAYSESKIAWQITAASYADRTALRGRCPGKMPVCGRVGPAFCRDGCRPRHPSRGVCARPRAMLLDGSLPLGEGPRPHTHGSRPGCAYVYRYCPQGSVWCNPGAYGVGMRLALILPGEGGHILTGCTPRCRCCMRRLDLSHDRDRRGLYGTSARLASSTGSARAVTGATEHPACPRPARSADTATSRGTRSRSATATLEAVHADVCHAGVPRHGLAARCHHRVSGRLPPRVGTAQAPAALARAAIVWAQRWAAAAALDRLPVAGSDAAA